MIYDDIWLITVCSTCREHMVSRLSASAPGPYVLRSHWKTRCRGLAIDRRALSHGLSLQMPFSQVNRSGRFWGLLRRTECLLLSISVFKYWVVQACQNWNIGIPNLAQCCSIGWKKNTYENVKKNVWICGHCEYRCSPLLCTAVYSHEVWSHKVSPATWKKQRDPPVQKNSFEEIPITEKQEKTTQLLLLNYRGVSSNTILSRASQTDCVVHTHVVTRSLRLADQKRYHKSAHVLYNPTMKKRMCSRT